ncbi:MAG TPA: phosphate ABC transporter substrate-binding protein PstS [Beijerinckia sp.]|jgi:phosphate transport system substrate-binding protein|nr:phosphate ABC transporter substrate-binding protein PstS [Beijerinckia sp.]
MNVVRACRTVITLALLTAAGVLSASAADESIVLRGAGSTFAAPLYKKWIETYETDHSRVSLNYKAVGSGEGINQFAAGLIDFGGTDTALTPEETAKIKGGVDMVATTAGMIVLAYNLPPLHGELKLPRDVYKDIFAGRIRHWNDPRIKRANPALSLPDEDIAVVARQDSSGTTAGFTAHLASIDPAWVSRGPGTGKTVDWPGGTMLARGNEGVATRIKISQGSIGYVEFGFASRLGLKTALLENKSGQFVEASLQNGEAAMRAAAEIKPDELSAADPDGDHSYPIVSYSWLLLFRHYPDTRKAEELRDFVRWGLTTGQGFASELGYIPLPPETAQHGIDALDRIN